MADVNANIGVSIDTSDALNQLKNLQRQISQFHQSVAKSSSAAAIAQRDLQKNFINGVNAIQGFSAELRTVRTSAESFTNSLEKNKFSIQQYFRYAASQTKTFGKNFTSEFSTIEKTAIERVKTLQTQYVKMGRDAQGAMQAIAIRPTVLNMKDLGTQTAIAAQKQVLFNQLIKQGSTNLLNFGKNTQWAGRQLMVGFTLPLATLGMTAGRVFMDMEKAAIKFKKVYGDLFTAPGETQKALDSITELGLAYTKYGVAVADTLSVASDAAAAGFQGVDLQNQTTASLKLSVLGQMELQKALETTIALQNAFRISSADLAGEIDFLNAVENQTVVSLDDITEAVPRVAPVIQSLGGDVKDLAFFLAAMKEGGVNAAQGANALKSGLASLINPTERAAEMLGSMGINIRSIVSQNQGDLRGTVVEFAKALDRLEPMKRAQAIEQLFGKFQFARISALFDNVIKEGSQASRVLDLAGSSLSELAALSDKELGVSAASAMNKFRAAVEQLKVALAPLGELFLEIATPFIDFATKVLDAFNNLPDGIKRILGTVITVIGGLGPVLLMTFGLINNGIANMIKFFATVRLGYLKMTGQAKGIGDETQYMTQEQLEAAAAAASLDQAHAGLTQRFTAEKTAVDALRAAYEQAAAAGARFAAINPGMMKPGTQATKYAKGGVVTVGGRGNKDTEPALLTPGEAVIPAAMVKKYQPLIEGMIAGNIPGYAKGVMLGMPKSAKSVSKGREASEEIYQMFLKSSYANTAPTEYGHQISPTSGHSFPIFGLGGVYQKGNKQVFVKPVLDEKAALAEMRSTEITRKAHGLQAPEQKIVVIRDPMDTTRQRRFLALESDLDPKFINNQPMGLFNEDQYFKQLVASLLRVDKDLSGSNVFGNVVADAGPAGVFNRASGLRDYEKNLPSMEDQALVNLLGIKGGAKRAFAESTLSLMSGLTPEQYKQRMLGEIQKVLPRLKETIASFRLTNPTEVGVYDDMVRRLEAGLGVDWAKFHSVHSAVKIPKPKVPKQSPAVPGYKDGVVSVPGPRGAGDVTPAMLAPGEAVIPAAMAKKYAPLIQGMIAGNIPGYQNGKGTAVSLGSNQATISDPRSAKSLELYYKKLLELGNTTEAVDKMFTELLSVAQKNKDGLLVLTKAQAEQAAKVNAEIKTSKASSTQLGHLQGTTKILPSGQRETGSLVRAMLPSQNKKLDQGGQNVEEFTRDWNSVTDGLVDTVKLGGAKITDGIKKATTEIDNEIRDIAVATAQNGKITDEILARATDQALLSAKTRGGDSATAAAALEKTKDMRVVKQATVDTLKESQAVKEAGIKFGDATYAQVIKRLESEGLLKQAKTSGGRTDYVATEKGAAFSAQGAGGRVARTRSTGEIVPAERSASNKSYLDIKQKTAIVKNIKDEVGQELQRASQSYSPSEKTIKATNNMVDGVTETLVNSKDDVAKATETMLSPVTQKRTGPRRASTDPAVMAAIAGNQAVVQASREPRRASRPADNTAPIKIDPNLENAPSKFMNNLSKASFALSSFTGILYMFGTDLGGIIPVISGISGALFGLISVSQALAGTKIAEIAATRLLTAAQTQGAVGNVAAAVAGGNVASMFGTMFVKGKGFMGFLTNIGKVAMTLLRGFGLLGLAITALTVGIPLIIKAFEDHANKVNGLGAAANLTEDKLNFLAEKFGVTAKSINWTERAAAAAATGAKSTEEKKQVVDLMIDPQFAEKFKTEIAGIKDATKEQAELALESLATQLRNSGFEDEAVSAIVSAIAAKAEQTNLDLKFNSILINDANTAQAAADLATKATDSYNKAAKNAIAQAQAAAEEGVNLDNVKIELDYKAIQQDPKMLQETKAAAGVAKTSIDALTLAFESGNLSADIYSQSLFDLFNTLSSAEQPTWMLQSLAEQMGLKDVVKDLTDANDVAMILQGTIAGVAGEDLLDEEDIKTLKEAADPKNAGNTRLLDKANKIRNDFVKATKAAVKEQQRLNQEKIISDDLAESNLEAQAVQAQIDGYHDLVAAGLSAELAYRLVGDSARLAAFQQAQLTDQTNKNTAAVTAFVQSAAMLDTLQKQFQNLNPSNLGGGGGGGQKSAFQEAIDSLKEQQKEAKSSIMAYAKLRSAGFGVAEASTIAKDSMLAAALASQKVGSRKWNQLVAAIKAARAEEEAWLNTTPEGRAEQFAGVYGKVMDVFNAQQAILEMNNKAATASTRKIIEALEKQIEVYQRRSAELERDLEKISEKEDEINKAYDEKTKALETVKKLNQDIINQQKSQLSIADALSRGDISAAASAMQDARAQSAASQGDAMGTALEASRQSQLNALTQNGKTRAQIEAEIKQIKKDISDIEFGALQNAKDIVDAADEALETAIENLKVQGKTRDEWENINTRIDASKANAALYEAEVLKALENAKGLVGEWEKLEETFTTTHVVNTIYTSSGNGPGPGPGPAVDPVGPTPQEKSAELEAKRTGPNAWRDQRSDITNRARIMESVLRSTYSSDGIGRLLSKYNTAADMATNLGPAFQGNAISAYTALHNALKTRGFASGGKVMSFMANGGSALGSDTVPAMLTPGEFVVKRPMVNKYGTDMLNSINSGSLGNLTGLNNLSNPVYNMPERKYPDVGDSGSIYAGSNGSSSLTAQDNSVYNNTYSLSVNVGGTDVSANEIANVVMNKIRTIESQQVRRQVLR